jgi:hypothetical protein
MLTYLAETAPELADATTTKSMNTPAWFAAQEGKHDCLKYLVVGESVKPGAEPTSPLRNYEASFTPGMEETAAGADGRSSLWWGDDMYDSDDSGSSVYEQPHSPDRPNMRASTSQQLSTTNLHPILEHHPAVVASSTGASLLRRRSSVGRVAYRWGLSDADAAEICQTFEAAQSSQPPLAL